jgi:Mrp family chromosome partitioning ATPase
MVTSPAPGDGKTLTTINLALCLAERAPTLLIDLDTRHSSVRRRVNIQSAGPGIEDALQEAATCEESLLSVSETRLFLCLNRGDGHSIIDLMAAGRPQRYLDWASRRFKWVLIDTPPAFPITDTLEIANHAPIGVMVVRARKTPAELLRQAIDALKDQIHYVVFNDTEAPSYSVYNRQYYFGDGEKAQAEK